VRDGVVISGGAVIRKRAKVAREQAALSDGDACKLTEHDISTLRFAAKKHADGYGIFAADAGQRSHFRRLERLGLIEFDTWGVDEDNHLRDVRLYKLTAKGGKRLTGHDHGTSASVRKAAS
jgi:hypothetical protein